MAAPPALGEFEQVVLLAILRLADDAYGLTIRREIAECTEREPAPGALYTTLDRLEEKGLVASKYGDPTPERGGRAIDLRPREFALLEYLMRNPGRVLTKTMILSHVWGYSFNPGTNVVDVLVSRLRDKIDRDLEPKLLHTVRGVGYVLKVA